ncbi:MAG: Chromosomal replication initiator protein DnaA [Micavibrio sp.]|nr:Chromosomal replication initiator protein DnaA [Micavibrio sp.]
MTLVSAQQIPLDLGHRIALGREDFLIAPCNQDAVGWIDRWPAWPAPALILQGPPASGKTHLGAVWKNTTDAAWVDAAVLSGADANDLCGSGHVVVDHFDPWIGDRDAETTLFHLYNTMKDRGTTLLLTMRTAPGQIGFSLPDLSSRLRAAPVASIQAPDDTLLAALLVKLFADRQLQIATDVLTYVLPRMDRSFAAARDVVDRADRLALAEKKAVTVPLMRQVLAAQD